MALYYNPVKLIVLIIAMIIALPMGWIVWKKHSECIAERNAEFDQCIVMQGGTELFCKSLVRLRTPERGC